MIALLKSLLTAILPTPKKCWLGHVMGEWKLIANPDEHITQAMYRAGMRPTHICTCDCGELLQLKLEEWQ